MSMLNFCLSLYGIHEEIDPGQHLGLKCNGIYVGTPTFVDDILLLANTYLIGRGPDMTLVHPPPPHILANLYFLNP